MSYRFNMFFKQINSKEEAYDFAIKTTKLLYKNMEEYILDNKYSIPSISSLLNNEMIEIALEETNKYWLFQLFSLNFTYWEEYKLLGLLGWNYSSSIKNLYDAQIYFQNSCDQDYEYEEWGTNINLFNEIVAEIKNGNNLDTLIKICFPYGYDEYDLEELKDDIDYYKKTAIYNLIFDKLHLNDWMYHREDDNDKYFTHFSLQALDCMEKHFAANLFLKDIVDMYKMVEKIEDLKEDIKKNEKKINELYDVITACKKDDFLIALNNYKSELEKCYSDYQNNVKEYNSLILHYNGKITEKLDFFEKGRKKEITTEEIDKKVKEVL